VDKTNPSAIALGVDIGATFIKAAIVNTNGELLEQFQAPSPRSVDALSAFVQSAADVAKLPLTGIGIGCKGIIDHTNSRVDRLPGDLHFLEGRYLSEVIGGRLPVSADNDARTALIAEVLWGAARGKRNIVLLTLGTGVGGAAMVDGVILHGATGIAGHFGHITVELNGGLCMCGNHGCLETLFSSRAIEADYFSHIHRAAPVRMSMSDGKPPSTEAIFKAASEGDESAQHVLDRALEFLAASVVSLLHIFDPELLIIGGNMAAAEDQLLEPLKSIVANRSRRMMGREVPIVPQSSIGYGGVLGAAGLIFLHQQLLKT
jgi:glucokinase